MSPVVSRQLNRFSRKLTFWRVELMLMWGLTALFAAAASAACIDLFARLNGIGRWTGFLLLAALGGATLVQISRILKHRYTPEGLAATIEHSYPELDNHLINYIQFSKSRHPDPLIAAYVREETPPLHTLEITRMKNRKRHRQGAAALSASALLLVGPFFFIGGHWATALVRMVNPLSSLQPATLTRILEVDPGDIEMRQGESVILTARVQGMRGHTVRIDLHPDDARNTVYDLGQISGEAEQAFSHRIPQANTRFQYRFRAGDAVPSEWFTVIPRPPPALTRLRALMEPPEYMRGSAIALDLTDDTPPVLPAGALLTVRATASVPLESLTLGIGQGEPEEMFFHTERNVWEHRLTITETGDLRLRGVDRHGQEIRERIAYVLKPDLPPVIDVIEPQGRVILPPGESPRIVFRVTDDYGLQDVRLERFTPGARDGRADVVAQWEPEGQRDLQQTWTRPAGARQTTVAYRIVAVDNSGPEPQESVSAPIMFNMPPAERVAEARDRLEAEGLAGLQQVIELQRENIQHSNILLPAAATESGDAWALPEERQREIRTQTRALLANPVRPLGGRTEAVNALYANEMLLAIEALNETTRLPSERRPQRATAAISLQATILRQLEAAQAAADRAKLDRRQTGISAMLTALVEEQSEIVEQIEEAGLAIFAELADRQDILSEDIVVFENACRREADSVRGNDPGFADLLVQMAQESRERRIREDMLMAAERLEQRALQVATPLATRAKENLVHLQSILETVEMQREETEREAMAAALGFAQEKMDRMEELHALMQESMDSIRGHGDESGEMFDILAEEFIEVLEKNKETLLTIPIDLHIFTDLNVGNELVEDVFSVFEEVIQKAGSENQTAEDLITFAYAKNLTALEVMREMQDRLDVIENWLMDEPEMFEVVTEAHDQEEMAEGNPLGALAAQVEDLIGDLLKESEEMADLSQDGATNHTGEDSGWDVMEGDLTSWSALGKSGNQAPDHKEQDGRSNVGRQGMAGGETAAGEGTIGEGDDNIQERRTDDPTQDGMVQLDGEADVVATGGGKLGSGKADEFGMEGGERRMDSTEEGSWEGMQALMARQADAVFAQASLQNVRLGSLERAAQHLRQADDAIAKGDIARIMEHRNMAIAALRQAQTELSARPTSAIQVGSTPSIIQDAVQSSPDAAPVRFQSQVAEYFKLLNEEF